MKLTLAGYGEATERRVATLNDAGAADRVWKRDVAFWGGDDARAKSVGNRLGWLDVPAQMLAQAKDIEAFAAEVRGEGFRDAVLLGMGGSSLAPEVLRQSIAAPAKAAGALTLHVLDTTDPTAIRNVTQAIDVTKTLFFVSSKSGTTIEALSLFAYFHELVAAAKPSVAGASFVAITDAGTPLQDLAKQHGFRRVFTNPGDIGGRYSALSYFGLVPAAVSGVDVKKLLERGVAAADAARAAGSEAVQLGAALGELAMAGRDKCTFVVSPAVASFGLWVEQLIAESTGKLGKGVLPVATEPLGTPQQYGDDRLFVQLRLASDNNGRNDSAIAALTSAGFPAVVIDLEDVYDLGREFFRWEFAVAIAGQVLAINPFDEPNVQESKDNTSRVLKEFESSGTLDVAGVDAAGSPVALVGGRDGVETDLSSVLAGLMEATGDGDYLAVTAYLESTSQTDAAFSEMRLGAMDARHVATTLGYGPRFLHSTGQLHKGGPSTGVFLQVTRSESDDIPIPARPFTFGQLKRAQSIGDFQSIVSHGRPVVRVHLGADVDAGLEALRAAAISAAGASKAR